MTRKSLSLRILSRSLVALMAGAFAAAPALAAGDAAVPEPGMLSILALAAAGVLIGRRLARRKPPTD